MKKRLLLLLMTVFALGWQGYAQGPVSCYGKLQVNGNKIHGAKIGAPVQIKGVSLGWSNGGWESASWFNVGTVNAMVDGWKAELIRVPLGVDADCTQYCTGYPTQPSQNLNRVKAVIDAAIAKDVYVIIDWHSHNAHMTTVGPNNYREREEAVKFFREMAQTYGNQPHVIFAIYNEPQSGTSWSTIKSYADEVIAAIRQHSTNLVIVGTRAWCTCLSEVRNNKIADTNTAYALHFYAHSHSLTGSSSCNNSLTFRREVEDALNGGLAVFVTEWGTTHADGGIGSNLNTHNAASSNAWHTFLDQNQISSAAWNVNHKNEGSAFFTSNFDKNTPSNFTNRSNMKVSGQYIYDMLQTWSTKAVWRNSCPSTCTNPLTVTFNTNGGSTVQSQSVCPAGTATRPSQDPTRSGYIFTNWYTAATGGAVFNFANPINANTTVHAQWRVNDGPTMVADCDKGNQTGFLTYWYSYNDAGEGGASTVSPNTLVTDFRMTAPGANGTDSAAVITYTLNRGSLTYDPFVGFGFDTKDPEGAFDLSCTSGITFYYRNSSSSNPIRFMVKTSNVTDAAYYGFDLPTSTNWTQITINWSQVRQPEYWGVARPWNPALITGFQWQIQATSGSGTVGVDEVRLNDCAVTLPSGPVSVASTESAAFSISPNPAKGGNFNVTLLNSETATLTIVSLQGQTIYSTIVENGFASLQTNLGAGVYIVSVQSESGSKTQKLVIK